MSKKKESKLEKDQSTPAKVRLPGFLLDEEEVGLGDLIKRVTTSVGIKPCGGCNKRAAALNNWVTFTRK